MKKIISVLLAAVLFLGGLAGCGPKRTGTMVSNRPGRDALTTYLKGTKID